MGENIIYQAMGLFIDTRVNRWQDRTITFQTTILLTKTLVSTWEESNTYIRWRYGPIKLWLVHGKKGIHISGGDMVQ